MSSSEFRYEAFETSIYAASERMQYWEVGVRRKLRIGGYQTPTAEDSAAGFECKTEWDVLGMVWRVPQVAKQW